MESGKKVRKKGKISKKRKKMMILGKKLAKIEEKSVEFGTFYPKEEADLLIKEALK